jgi:hypothetical protein
VFGGTYAHVEFSVDVVVDDEVVDHAHAMRLHRMLAFAYYAQRIAPGGGLSTCVLVIADIVVVEVAHPLARHPAKSSLLQRYCVWRARQSGNKRRGEGRNAVKAKRKTFVFLYIYVNKVYIFARGKWKQIDSSRTFLRTTPNSDFQEPLPTDH